MGKEIKIIEAFCNKGQKRIKTQKEIEEEIKKGVKFIFVPGTESSTSITIDDNPEFETFFNEFDEEVFDEMAEEIAQAFERHTRDAYRFATSGADWSSMYNPREFWKPEIDLTEGREKVICNWKEEKDGSKYQDRLPRYC